MPSRIWSHVCSFATIDYFGRVSIIEEIDTFYAAQLPAMIPTMYIASKWEGYEGETYTLQIRMSHPVLTRRGNSKYFFEGPPQNFTVGQNYPYIAKIPDVNFSLVSMFTVTFTDFGEYPIEFLIDDNPVYIAPFKVVQWKA